MNIVLKKQGCTIGKATVLEEVKTTGTTYLLITAVPGYSLGVSSVYADGTTPKENVTWEYEH